MKSSCNAAKAAMLVSRCFNARTQAHVLHLGTKSYSEHMALGAFYSEIGELVDGFAEAFQGLTGELLRVPAVPMKAETAVQMLESLQDWIDGNREEICDVSNIQNEIDSVMTLVQSTLYKLKFLK